MIILAITIIRLAIMIIWLAIMIIQLTISKYGQGEGAGEGQPLHP